MPRPAEDATFIELQRELNEMEYFNWCVAQPYNMVAAVKIRGQIAPDALRHALDQAQRRHPLLRVNSELGPGGLPWFSSRGVGAIPLSVIEHAEPDAASRLAASELVAVFARDEPGGTRLPLLRVALLLPRDPAELVELVLTIQHVIADGLSVVFLVRDLLHFLEAPGAPVSLLDAPASSVDLLPPKVRRRIPKSSLRFRVVLWLVKLYVRLCFGRRAAPAKQLSPRHRSWQLTADQTSRLRARCRKESVSVQSALCAAFLTGFSAIHVPVSLRPYLARPVGESVGLFVGAAEVRMKYRAGRSLWENARGFQRRLRRALRDPFGIFRLFSKAVPAELVGQLGPLLVRIMSKQQPFAITNLGELDADKLGLSGMQRQIVSFFGAVTGIVDSSVLTVSTIGGSMHLHLLANESGPTDTAIVTRASDAVDALLAALAD